MSKLPGQHLQAIERGQIAKELRDHALQIDKRLRDARRAGVLRKACPCAPARAFQIDRGNLSVSDSPTVAKVQCGAHGDTRKATPANAMADPLI